MGEAGVMDSEAMVFNQAPESVERRAFAGIESRVHPVRAVRGRLPDRVIVPGRLVEASPDGDLHQRNGRHAFPYGLRF